MLIKILNANSEVQLDSWQVGATYPLPNVGDRVKTGGGLLCEVRSRVFKKDVIVLYVD